MADRQGSNLTVTGTGKVQVAPDEAVVHLSILTEGRTAAEAVSNNAVQTQAVISAVSVQPNHGLTTSGLSVSPIISYEPEFPAGRIVGFRATNGVEVTTKVDYVGQIYDAGVMAGANLSSGITFRVQNETPYREQALRLAIQGALDEARVVAAAAKLDLGEVESIQVEPGDGIILFRSEAFDAKIARTPVIPERQTITARVHVQLRMRGQLDIRPGKPDRDGREQAARPGGTS